MTRSRTGWRWLVVVVAAVVVCAAPADVAWAGSLGDFKDSYRDHRDDDEDDSSDDDEDDSWDDGGYYDDSSSGTSLDLDEDLSCLGDTFAFFLLGYRPGYTFSYGRTPFRDRGYLGDIGGRVALASNDDEAITAAGFDAWERARYGWLRFRGEGLITPQGDALGFGVFAKIGSSFTPSLGLRFSHAAELESEETLYVGEVMLEPRFWVDDRFSFEYAMGINWLGDQRELLGWGPSAGLSAELYPFDPLTLEVRALAHFPALVPVGDIYVGLGVQPLGSPVGLTVGWRRLVIRGGATLDLFGAGLSLNLGL